VIDGVVGPERIEFFSALTAGPSAQPALPVNRRPHAALAGPSLLLARLSTGALDGVVEPERIGLLSPLAAGPSAGLTLPVSRPTQSTRSGSLPAMVRFSA